MAEVKHTFEVGVMWEDGPWFISENHQCSSYGGKPCPHCHGHRDVEHRRSDGSTFIEKVWVCPKVVVVENESGHNSTGLCLACLLEAAEQLRASTDTA